MSNFVPNKPYLRGILLHYFIQKKSAAEAHRILVETYGDHALSERTCRDWFNRFKNDDFHIQDRERSGAPKKFEDEEFETLLDEDPCQTQSEVAKSLGVDRTTVSKRLTALGMIQKEGSWVPYDLKPRDVERRLFACEQLLQRQKRKGFLHRIVTGDEKWIYYDNPKRKKSWVKPGQAVASTPKRNIHGSKLLLCIWWDQLGVVYYELLQPNQTITGALYRLQLMRLSRALKAKRPQYNERHDKVILQHDNARPHVASAVKTYLETLKWEVLPHPPYSPDIAPSDYYLFRSMTHGLAEQHFTSYEDTKKWVDSWIASKDLLFFQRGIQMLPERWEKVVASDGQYFN
ncbi:Mariner Mos1 transposase [Anthophora quadrimaculata]